MEKVPYDLGWIRRVYDKSNQMMSIEDDLWDISQSQRKVNDRSGDDR